MSLLDKLDVGSKKSKPKAKTKQKQKKTKVNPNRKADLDRKVIGLFGKQATGKTFASLNIAKHLGGRTLYLDLENKAFEIVEEQYNEMEYNIRMPPKYYKTKDLEYPNIKDVFRPKADIDFDIVQRLDGLYNYDYVETYKALKRFTPIYIQLIESGKYQNVVIDNCSPLRKFAYDKWLADNPKRQRPNKFEWGEITAIVQEVLMPFINASKINNLNLILTFGITGEYINDIKIGYKEDAKQWLLGVLSYEIWLEWDYKKYCLKHPYKQFWEVRDEEMNIGKYLFDKEFLESEVIYKDYLEFKEETLLTESQRAKKSKSDSKSLKIGH
jgi:hypothetical protein